MGYLCSEVNSSGKKGGTYIYICTPRQVLWSLADVVFITVVEITVSLLAQAYEGVSKSFRTGRLELELQMVQISATRCSRIAIL
jgi:hypothetical protein